jgi:hypothetical protein
MAEAQQLLKEREKHSYKKRKKLFLPHGGGFSARGCGTRGPPESFDGSIELGSGTAKPSGTESDRRPPPDSERTIFAVTGLPGTEVDCSAALPRPAAVRGEMLGTAGLAAADGIADAACGERLGAAGEPGSCGTVGIDCDMSPKLFERDSSGVGVGPLLVRGIGARSATIGGATSGGGGGRPTPGDVPSPLPRPALATTGRASTGGGSIEAGGATPTTCTGTCFGAAAARSAAACASI